VSSGTEIREYVEWCVSAALALESVTRLLAQRLPNVRVFNEDGERVSVEALLSLTAEENEPDDI
jgi:hypothetical protein